MKSFDKEMKRRSYNYYVRYKNSFKTDDFEFIHKTHHVRRGSKIRIKNQQFYEVSKTGTETLIEKDDEHKSFELCILDTAIKNSKLKSHKKRKIYQDINKRSKVRSREIVGGKSSRNLVTTLGWQKLKVYEQPEVFEGKDEGGKEIWRKVEPLCLASFDLVDDKPICYFKTKGKGNDIAHEIRNSLIIKYVLEFKVGYEFMVVHTGLKKRRILKIVSSYRNQPYNEMFDILLGLKNEV